MLEGGVEVLLGKPPVAGMLETEFDLPEFKGRVTGADSVFSGSGTGAGDGAGSGSATGRIIAVGSL